LALQLTGAIDEDPESCRSFDAARAAAKRHLGSNAFYDKSLPKDHVYNAPDFGVPKDHPADRRKRFLAAMSEGPVAYDAILDSPQRRKLPTE
jgi:hypothetical protein